MLGADPATAGREWREQIGIVLQQCRMRPELTVRETLELYAGYYRDPLGRRRDDRARRPRREGRRPRRAALRRPAAPPRRRRRADRRPGPALPRRADHRLRPLRAPPGLGRDRRPARARQDRLPHHPLHGRGAAPRRPRRDHRRRARSSPRDGPTSSATAGARPTTISFRLPNGTPPGDLPVQPQQRAGTNGELVIDDRRAGRGAQPAHRLGAGALGGARRGSRSHRPSLEDIYLELTATPAAPPRRTR